MDAVKKTVAKKTAVKKTAVKKTAVRDPKVAVSESNIAKAAMRLLSQRLVSAEISYVQRVLGSTASQTDIDTQVLAVRKMPWGSIVVND
jgi:hypothetical protein